MLKRLFPNLASLDAAELMALPIVGLALFGFSYGVTKLALGIPSLL